MKVLKAIFDFYSKQQMLLGKMPTFDQIEKNSHQMSLGEFNKFCADFGLLHSFVDIPTVVVKQCYANTFRSVADNRKEIDFDKFKNALYFVFSVDQ
mmetsp:Transcript_38430/g.58516  ORF Transcript_38430/g.58516 Transcript_38430/m.58516 type:complete len:96 (-) Transcript_38430:167-454(-)